MASALAAFDDDLSALCFGSVGAPGTKVKGCREQTRRASTPAALSKAQNSCAPTSRDPCNVLAAFRKSAFLKQVSTSSGNWYCKIISDYSSLNWVIIGLTSFSCVSSAAQSAPRRPLSVTENLDLNISAACFSPVFKDSVCPNCDKFCPGFK